MDLLCALQSERGMTLVMVTHDSRVASRAPEVLELEDGRVRVG
jgi:predicted ABC-type transport system involved in lysophospholipase L1 biosynthesis ATPase subunit